jgi:hypothetical protein
MKKITSSRNRVTRRQVNKGLVAGLALGSVPLAARAAGRSRLVYRGAAASLPVDGLGTLKLVNDSRARATIPGTPTDIFGWVFAPGQINPGEVPVFRAGGVVQRFSANPANARRYWPDGSLMFCAFMLRPSFSVQPGGSHAVEISKTTGIWPAGGARSIAEIYHQNFAVNCPPSGLAGVDPTVPYGAWLTSANARNIVQTRHWLTGDAGECWGFTVNMSQTPGAAPHGQLVCNVYMVAVSGPDGNLGGFRFWADLRQPYFTVDSVPKQIRLFAPPNPATPTAGVNYSINGKAFAPPNWRFPSQFTLTSVNTKPTPIDVWPGRSGYYGQLSGSNGSTYFGCPGNFQIMPVLVSESTVPGWGNGISWLATGGSGQHAQLFWGSAGGGGQLIDPKGPGSATLSAAFWLQPFCRMSIGGADGEYIFFRGSGSIATDTPLRSSVVDQLHWARSKVIPPWNTNLKGSVFGGSIPDLPWNYPYNPYSQGALPQSLSAAGNGGYLNSIDNNDIREFYNGTSGAYRQMIAKAMSVGKQCYDIVDDKFPNAPVNFSNNLYPGVGAPATYLQGGASGFAPAWYFGPNHKVPQGPHFEVIGFDESTGDHAPNYVGMAYLRTGRLELLDRAMSQVNIIMANSGRNSTVAGYQSYGTVTAAPGQMRDWSVRNLTFAAIIVPNDPSGLNNPGNIAFDGSQIGPYLTDLSEANFKMILDVQKDAAGLYGAAHHYFAQRTLWVPVTPNGSGHAFFSRISEWEAAFYAEAACWGAASGGANAIAALKMFAARWNYVRSKYGFWNLYNIVCDYGLGSDQSGHVYDSKYLITDDDHWTISPTNTWPAPQMSYAVTPSPGPTSLAFSVTSWFNNGYVPQNGDVIMFITGSGGTTILPPGTAAANVPYRIADLMVVRGSPSTYRYNLADRNGRRIAITSLANGGTINWMGWRSGREIKVDGSSFGLGYVGIFYEVATWAKHVTRITDFDAIWTDAIPRFNHSNENKGPGLFQFGGDCRYVLSLP